jgi:hypothetical protein
MSPFCRFSALFARKVQFLRLSNAIGSHFAVRSPRAALFPGVPCRKAEGGLLPPRATDFGALRECSLYLLRPFWPGTRAGAGPPCLALRHLFPTATFGGMRTGSHPCRFRSEPLLNQRGARAGGVVFGPYCWRQTQNNYHFSSKRGNFSLRCSAHLPFASNQFQSNGRERSRAPEFRDLAQGTYGRIAAASTSPRNPEIRDGNGRHKSINASVRRMKF